MNKNEIYLCAPVRTAIGTYNGTLKNISATELGATAIKACIEKAGINGSLVDSVTMGQVIQAGAKMNPARQATINSGLPVEVPAQTINRVCGSGAQAIITAAQEVMLGHANCSIAGGMENMDQAPYLMSNGRWGYRLGHANILDSILNDGLNDAFSDEHSGWHTEDLVTEMNISRTKQDEWACRSHELFSKAQQAGLFKDEITPIIIPNRKGDIVFDEDEHNRPDITLEALTKLRPAFRKDGTITAGNAPGLNSGAAAMIIANASFVEQHNLKPMGKLVSYGIGAVEPGMFGLGPVPAVQQALSRANWKMTDIDRIEINEAFAAIALAVTEKLGLAHDIVNVDGGAVAHGHAIGATGTILTTRLLHSMQRDNIHRGIVTLCIGGGQGIALAIESVS